MATESSSADTPKSDSPDLATEAVNFLTTGKRHLVCNEIPAAVNSLQEACRLLAAQYGETADECGEAYLYYGRSLLELARMENGVLGNALDDVPDEGDENLSQDEQFENANNIPDGEGNEAQGETSPDGEETSQDEGGEAKEGEEDADDVPNLQLAWEMLELAKFIFSRQDSKEMSLRTADCHNYLGEVSLETEQYESAVSDFLECLKIQQKQLEADNRQIAESHYQLGLSYLFNKQYDLSIKSLKSAASCIKEKIANLTKVVEADTSKGKDVATADNPIDGANKEIKELNDILPDILAKIEDAEEEKRDAEQAKKMALATLTAGLGASTSGFGASTSSEGTTTIGFGASSSSEGTTTVGFGAPSSTAQKTDAVHDITSMVRKKRKPEDNVSQTGESKKSRGENGSGESVPNGVNGHVNGSNGVSSKEASSETKEIQVKSVEDVLKAKEAAQ